MDSRGRPIQSGMETTDIICRSYSGGTLCSIRPHVEDLIKQFRPVTCVILVGINDLTLRNKSTRTVILAKFDSFDLANMVITRILNLRRYLILRFADTKFFLGGINGIDIARYNRDEYWPNIQRTVDDCITQVNAYLRLLNRIKVLPAKIYLQSSYLESCTTS